jgi:hypothetical protein
MIQFEDEHELMVTDGADFGQLFQQVLAVLKMFHMIPLSVLVWDRDSNSCSSFSEVKTTLPNSLW